MATWVPLPDETVQLTPLQEPGESTVHVYELAQETVDPKVAVQLLREDTHCEVLVMFMVGDCAFAKMVSKQPMMKTPVLRIFVSSVAIGYWGRLCAMELNNVCD
jgi:hypothetical protein